MKPEKKKLWNRDYVLLLCAMLSMTTALTMNSAVITPYVVSLGYNLEIASTIAGIMTITSMAARPISGMLGDRMVKKRVVCVASLFSAIAVFLMAFPISLTLLGVLRVAFGILFSVSTTVMMAMITDCVPAEKTGAGLGYYGVGLGVAQAIGPPIGFWAANRFGYPSVYILAAGLIAACALCIALIPAVPVEMGGHCSSFSLKALFAPEILPLLPGCFCIGAILGVENSFLALYAQSNGIANVGWYFTLYGIFMILVRLLTGQKIDRLPFSTVYYAGTGVIAATLFLFSVAEHLAFVPTLVGIALIRATGIGIYQPALQNACMMSVPATRRSSASGMYYLGSDLGMGLTPILGAKLYTASLNSYPKMFLALMAFPLVGAAVFAICRKGINANIQKTDFM